LDRDEPSFVETTGNHNGNCLSAEIGKLHKFLLSTDVGESTIKLVSARWSGGAARNEAAAACLLIY
jgi:hypothetical protein